MSIDPRAELHDQIIAFIKDINDHSISGEKIHQRISQILKLIHALGNQIDVISYQQIQFLRDKLSEIGSKEALKLDATVKELAKTALLLAIPDILSETLEYESVRNLLKNFALNKSIKPLAIEKAIDQINKKQIPLVLWGLKDKELGHFLKSYGSKLEYLDLSHLSNDFLIDFPLWDLLEVCPNIKFLKLGSLTPLQNYISPNRLIDFFTKHGSKLLYLKIKDLNGKFLAQFPLRNIGMWCPNLQNLNLSNCDLNLEQLRDILAGAQDLSNLKILNLSYNIIPAEEILAIGQLGKLEEIILTQTFARDDLDQCVIRLASILNHLPHLQRFVCTSNEIGLASFEAFNSFASALGGCRNLKALNLEENFIGSVDGFRKSAVLANILAHFTHINELNLSDNPIKEISQFSTNIGALKELKDIHINNIELNNHETTDIRNFLLTLKKCPLVEIDIGNNDLNAILEMPSILTALFEGLSKLRLLFINGNNIGLRFEEFAGAIANLKNLVYLHLDENGLNNTHIGALIDLGRKLPKIRHIDLFDQLDEDEIIFINKALTGVKADGSPVREIASGV